MKSCFLFPGQGAQYPGMGKDLYDQFGSVRDLFTLASDVTGIDVKNLLFEGSEEALSETNNTQIAVTLINVAAASALSEKGIEAEGCAGFSLGEYAALWYSGIIDAETLFRLVKARGSFMERAVASLVGASGMAAVIGITLDKMEETLRHTPIEKLFIANYNSPNQIVIGGLKESIEKSEALLKDAGAKRVIPLKVSGPFHTPLMEEAAESLKEYLESVTFNDPLKRGYSNVTGRPITSGQEAKELAVKQITGMVRWVDEEQAILSDSYERLFETGPGRVLTGLWRSISGDVTCSPVGTIELIEKAELL